LAKLIKILATSVGGGLVLGAGIRLGEAIAARYPAAHSGTSGDDLLSRLGDLEQRLQVLEAATPPTQTDGQFAHRAAEVSAEISAIRRDLEAEGRQSESAGEVASRLRGELRGWLEENVAERMAEVESRLRSESELGQKRGIEAFAENVQTRVIHRIVRLEEEVAGQSAAMGELRECSVRAEQSMQRLLGGLDKLIKNQPKPGEPEKVRPAADAVSGSGTVEARLAESRAAESETSAGERSGGERTDSERSDSKPADFTLPESRSLLATRPQSPSPLNIALVDPPAFNPPSRRSRWKIFR
jgi:hypothetical protein